MSSLTYKSIGVVHSPFKEPKNVPIQAASKATAGTLEIYPEYVEGLQDVEGFSHLILLYHFHLIEGCSLLVKPFLDDNLHGVFSTRSPARPNKIGLSVVKLIEIKNSILHIQNVDIIDGTPLLDIKPFVPDFDCRNTNKIGWLGNKMGKFDVTKDDGRFWK